MLRVLIFVAKVWLILNHDLLRRSTAVDRELWSVQYRLRSGRDSGHSFFLVSIHTVMVSMAMNVLFCSLNCPGFCRSQVYKATDIRPCFIYHHPSTPTMQVPPPDLSEDDRRVVFEFLDVDLHRLILESLLHG